MRQIHQIKSRFLSSKAMTFLIKSFCFALLYSTLLYALVRLFFNDFPFTISEGFELHSKTLLVVWAFIIACKLVLSAITLAENYLNKTNTVQIMNVTSLKRSFFILLATVLTNTVKTPIATGTKLVHDGHHSNDESTIDPGKN